MGFFERLKDGLQKTRKNFTERIEVLVGMSAEIDDDFLDEMKNLLKLYARQHAKRKLRERKMLFRF